MKRKGYLYIILLFIIELAILLYTMLGFKVQSHSLYEGDIVEFNSNWVLKVVDKEPVTLDTLPYKGKSPADSEVELINVLPEEFRGLTMYFLSTDKKIWVYVDDECVYEFGVKDRRNFGKSPGAMINYVDLPQNYTEGNIRIVMVSPFEDVATNINEIMVARRDIAVLRLLANNILEIISSIILLVGAIVFFVCGLANHIGGENTEGTYYMAVFSFTAAIYYLIQSRVLYLFYGNALAYMQIDFTFLMHMPILIAAYYKANFPKKYHPRLDFIIVVGIVNVFVQQLAYIFNIAEYVDMMGVSHLIIAAGTLMIIICFIGIFQDGKKEFAIKGCIILMFVFVGSIIDIIRVYRLASTDLVKYSRLGAVIYCVVLQVYHISRLLHRYNSNLEENARLLQNENQELAKARDEADAAKQEALRANEAKNHFLARISHEIRTPINAVLGMDSMILRESSEESIKGYAADIKNAGNTLLSLINDILDFSKMESGNLEVLPTEYDVSSMLHDIINMIEPRLKSKDLNLDLQIDEDIPSRLFGDDVRVRQIIVNILTNAVKYTEKGTVTFKVKCLYKDEQKASVFVDVTDTGIGIKEEDLKNIAVAFKRIEESRNRHIEGTGLGMSITVQLLSMMNSELKIKSEYGKGSSFSFVLEQGMVDDTPIGKFQERIAQRAADYSYNALVYAPEANILVVDDNSMNLKVFRGLLKHTGVQIMEAESGMESLTLVQKKHFDLIFMDHMMPGLDGIETLKHMNEMEHMCKDTPVIVLTANAVVGAKEMYLESGFKDFLSKPVIPEKLEEMLIKYLPEHLQQPVEKMPQQKQSKSEAKLEDFPVVEGIDWKFAMEHFTEVEFLIDAVTNFYNTIESDMETLNRFYDDIDNEESLEQYRIKVHAMKSTTALIGAMSLSGLARLLEYAARDKETDTIIKLSPVFYKRMPEAEGQS